MYDDITFDIETIGPSKMDPAVLEYLTKRAEKYDKEVMPAVELGLARIIAIGTQRTDSSAKALIVAPGWGGTDNIRSYEDEKSMLFDFWRGLKNSRLITFNGRSFDGPMIAIRSAILGLVAQRDIVGYRFDISSHCDIADILCFQGATRSAYSLDYWSRVFGLKSPKDGFSAKDVEIAYEAKEYEKIGDYVLKDVETTSKIYARLRDFGILKHFKGGPRGTC
jgi:DNA polymerase elongation subunit (family B)